MFPGLEEGERLTPAHATSRSGRRSCRSDGKVLAEGPAGTRSSPLGEVGLVDRRADGRDRGRRGAQGALRARVRRATRWWAPPAWSACSSAPVEGKPGGTLRAGARTLASSEPVKAKAVRSTIDTRIQAAAVTALAGRLGGIAAIDTRTGQVRALAGIAFSAPQPPGLGVQDRDHGRGARGEEGEALRRVRGRVARADRRRDARERQRRAVRRHLRPELRQVVQLGVRAARREGGLQEAGRDRRAVRLERASRGSRARRRARCPTPRGIVSPLEIGSTAIGQFKVLATPLQMASVAQTVANDGVRLAPDARARRAAEARARDLGQDRLDDRGADDRRGGLRHAARRRRSPA